jgi:FAD synthetase
VEDFVSDSVTRYNLKLVQLGGDMKEVLEHYLEGDGDAIRSREVGQVQETTSKKKRNVKAMFLGTRRTDPHGGMSRVGDLISMQNLMTEPSSFCYVKMLANLKPRNRTDAGWPDVERIQPILDWSYQDVWAFLRCPVFAVEEERISRTPSGVRWGEPYGIPYCILYDEG